MPKEFVNLGSVSIDVSDVTVETPKELVNLGSVSIDVFTSSMESVVDVVAIVVS